MEGFEKSPYYLDIILRRILLRVFAEEWLWPKQLAELFKTTLDLQPLNINVDSCQFV
jgi:hypothetical protein